MSGHGVSLVTSSRVQLDRAVLFPVTTLGDFWKCDPAGARDWPSSSADLTSRFADLAVRLSRLFLYECRRLLCQIFCIVRRLVCYHFDHLKFIFGMINLSVCRQICQAYKCWHVWKFFNRNQSYLALQSSLFLKFRNNPNQITTRYTHEALYESRGRFSPLNFVLADHGQRQHHGRPMSVQKNHWTATGEPVSRSVVLPKLTHTPTLGRCSRCRQRGPFLPTVGHPWPICVTSHYVAALCKRGGEWTGGCVGYFPCSF